MNMGTISCFMMLLWKVGLLVLVLAEASSATLSPTGVNYEGDFLSFYLLEKSNTILFWYSE